MIKYSFISEKKCLVTKDTRDKNKDKASWPLSCCIPDLPLDKSDPTEIFRGPQGCIPGYVQKCS